MRIASVRLDSFAWFARDQRRRDDLAHERALLERTSERKPARTGLVTSANLAATCLALELLHELLQRWRVVLDRPLDRLRRIVVKHRDSDRLLVRV